MAAEEDRMEEKHAAFADALTLMLPDTPPPGAVYKDPGGLTPRQADQTDWVQTVNALRTYARGGHYAPGFGRPGGATPAGIRSGFFGITEEAFTALRTLIYGS